MPKYMYSQPTDYDCCPVAVLNAIKWDHRGSSATKSWRNLKDSLRRALRTTKKGTDDKYVFAALRTFFITVDREEHFDTIFNWAEGTDSEHNAAILVYVENTTNEWHMAFYDGRHFPNNWIRDLSESLSLRAQMREIWTRECYGILLSRTETRGEKRFLPAKSNKHDT